ncbi:MAG: IS1634 family transposase [Planctomycetota bacterium]
MLQLLESYRNAEGNPRQRVVISLGNADIPEQHLKDIAIAVEKRLYGRQELFSRDLPADAVDWIDTIVRRVDLRGRWQPLGLVKHSSKGKLKNKSKDSNENKQTTVDGVLVDRVSHTNTSTLGPELVGWHAWNKLQIPELLEQLGFNEAQKKAAAISVINRLVEPVSELGLLSWLKTSALPELIGEEVLGASKDRFYRVSDKLLKNHTRLEAHLRQEQRKAFSLKRTIFLYDLTNTYFEGAAKSNPKAKRGKSKHKRNDCPQLVVGMVFDQYGFELAHRMFEGNRNDSTTLVEIVKALQTVVKEEADLFNAGKPLVIVDAGVATQANLQILKENGFDYLVNDSRRGRAAYREEFLKKEGFATIQDREGKTPVEVCMIKDPVKQKNKEGQKETHKENVVDRLVLCRSQARRGKEAAIRSKAEDRFLEATARLKKRIEKGQIKQKEKIDRAVGRILAKNSRVARFYTIEVEEAKVQESEEEKPDKKAKKSNIKAPLYRLECNRNEESYQTDDELLGCYVLRTSKDDLEAKEIWSLYITLSRAEDGFRALKSDLGLRPIRHHKEDRGDAHVLITALAYQLLQYILHTLRGQGDVRSWGTLKRVLGTHCYTTIILPTTGGEIHRIRKAGIPEEGQKEIYRALGVEWDNLPTKRSCSSTKTATTL